MVMLATSVHVEHIFSKGQILLFHLCSCLSVQSTRALMCVREWSLKGYVKANDINIVAVLPDIKGEKEDISEEWDVIELLQD